MNDEEQGSQTGKQVGQLLKNAIKQGAKQGVRKILGWIMTAIAPILPYVIGAVLIICILWAGIDFLVDLFTVEASAQVIQTTLVEKTTHDNEKWIIDSSMYDTILDQLKESGLSLSGLEKEDIQKLVEAEFGSVHPKLSEKDDIGIVTFYRKAYNANADDAGTLMTYMDKDTFYNHVNSSTEGDYNTIKNRFTLEEQTTTVETENGEMTEKEYIVVIARYTKVSGAESSYTITPEKINYKMLVENYTTPLEFFIANYQITNSRRYILAIADMVSNNSKIEFCIQDQYSEVKETPVEEWHEEVYEPIYFQYLVIGQNLISEGEKQNVGATRTTETITLATYLKNVDTWIAKVQQNYTCSCDPNNPEVIVADVGLTELPDETIQDGDYTIYKTNRIEYTKTESKIVSYTNGVTTTAGTISATAVDGDGYTSEYPRNGRKYKEYKQNDGSYKSNKYWDGTISSSGCGPTAVAIVASGFIDGYSPADFAKMMVTETNGTKMSNAFTALGISNKNININNKEQILNELKQGKVMVLSVNNSLNKLFANGTHIIAVLDVNENNEVYVSNPNKLKKSGWFSIDQVFTCANGRYAVVVEDTSAGNVQGDNGQTQSGQENQTAAQGSSGQVESNENKFLGLWKNSTGKYEKYYNDDGTINENALYKEDGKKVIYGGEGSPVENIFGASDWFFDLLAASERTQTHEQFMRYIMYVYSGKSYGVDQFDFSIFNASSFSNNFIGNRITYESLNLTESDLQILYKVTSAERGNGTQQQQEYVVSVILNRVLSTYFPNTVYGVVFAPSQFSSTTDGNYDKANPSETTKAAVQNVIANGDTSQGALYFMTPNAAEKQSWLSKSNIKFLFNDGDNGGNNTHNFYTDINKLDDLKQYMKYTGSVNTGELYNADGSVNEDAMIKLQEQFAEYVGLDSSSRLPLSKVWVGYGNSSYLTDSIAKNRVKNIGVKWYGTNNRLEIFQCTWWANARASQYLQQKYNYSTGYPVDSTGRYGNGGEWYNKNKTNGWFKYGKTPKPNSLVSWKQGSNAGHVAYVEAVDEVNKKIYISHAGGGKYWYGVKAIPYNGSIGSSYSLNGYIYLDEPNKINL